MVRSGENREVSGDGVDEYKRGVTFTKVFYVADREICILCATHGT